MQYGTTEATGGSIGGETTRFTHYLQSTWYLELAVRRWQKYVRLKA